MKNLKSLAKQVAVQMRELRVRLVCAESCTGGLVAATITSIPGASEWFCGSAVTYRDETKAEWLGVNRGSLENQTAVSQEVAQEMVLGVLRRTPEADIGLSITGHLGPGAPTQLDGIVFLAFSTANAISSKVATRRISLTSTTRHTRQRESASFLLGFLLEQLENY